MKNKNNNVDERLREIFHRELPDAPQSPWFTRKVMNRLPERKRPAISVIEWIGGGVAAAILLSYWLGFVRELTQTQVVTVNDVVTLCSLLAMTMTLIGVSAVNILRRA